MPNVRAKFIVVSIGRQMGHVYDAAKGNYVAGEQQTVRLHPVSGNDEENKKFYAATPSGSIELSVVRPDMFELGKEYYVDFTLAEVE